MERKVERGKQQRNRRERLNRKGGRGKEGVDMVIKLRWPGMEQKNTGEGNENEEGKRKILKEAGKKDKMGRGIEIRRDR